MFSTLYTGQRTTEFSSLLTMWTLDGRLRLSGLVADAFMYGAILCVLCRMTETFLQTGYRKRIWRGEKGVVMWVRRWLVSVPGLGRPRRVEGSFDCAYPVQALGGRRTMGSLGTLLRGGGAQCEVPGDCWSWLRGPGPAWRPGTSGSQTLGHPGTTGSLGRAENGVSPPLDLAWG